MRYQSSSNLTLSLKALLLVGGMATALLSLQGCIGDSDAAGDQKEQARVKDKAPKDTNGTDDQICIAVVVCGADGKMYGTPCAADAAKVKWSYDMGNCGGRTVQPIEPILRCGNDSIPDVSIDPIIPPDISIDPVIPPDVDDPEVCAAVMVCDDDGKRCHSLCE